MAFIYRFKESPRLCNPADLSWFRSLIGNRTGLCRDAAMRFHKVTLPFSKNDVYILLHPRILQNEITIRTWIYVILLESKVPLLFFVGTGQQSNWYIIPLHYAYILLVPSSSMLEIVRITFHDMTSVHFHNSTTFNFQPHTALQEVPEFENIWELLHSLKRRVSHRTNPSQRQYSRIRS